jgi:periplasmic divalent cation tolerance protein
VVERRLAACANVWPAESMYWWKGALEETAEFVIVFKTRRSLLRKLIAAVRAIHPYEVPCIVSYPMGDALPEYLDWIDAETAQR